MPPCHSFDIQWKWYHDLSVDSMSEHTVYASGKGVDINIDCHRAGERLRGAAAAEVVHSSPCCTCLSRPPLLPAAVHNNLFSQLDTGLGSRTFNSGGAKDRGAYSGANTTWWNVFPASKKKVNLPDCTFGPLLNFFGSWNEPRGRRLLAVEGATDSSVAAAAGPADGEGATVDAAAVSNWCGRQGWLVEQLDSGKVIAPPEIYAAQLQARLAGRIG